DDPVRPPLRPRGVGRALLEQDTWLHEGGIGREGPSEATALLPRFGLASDGRIQALSGADSSEQRDADVLVKTAVGRPEVDVAAENRIGVGNWRQADDQPRRIHVPPGDAITI